MELDGVNGNARLTAKQLSQQLHRTLTGTISRPKRAGGGPLSTISETTGLAIKERTCGFLLHLPRRNNKCPRAILHHHHLYPLPNPLPNPTSSPAPTASNPPPAAPSASGSNSPSPSSSLSAWPSNTAPPASSSSKTPNNPASQPTRTDLNLHLTTPTNASRCYSRIDLDPDPDQDTNIALATRTRTARTNPSSMTTTTEHRGTTSASDPTVWIPATAASSSPRRWDRPTLRPIYVDGKQGAKRRGLGARFPASCTHSILRLGCRHTHTGSFVSIRLSFGMAFRGKKGGGGSINSAIAAQPSPAQHLFIYTYPFPRQRCFWSCPVLSSSVPPVGRGVSPLCSPPPILLVIYPSYCPVTYE